MTSFKTAALAVVVISSASTAALAEPTAFAPVAAASVAAATPVLYGYGPTPYGLYGHRRRFYARRSYGTGYHGRGTRTGGPVGGLPSRN